MVGVTKILAVLLAAFWLLALSGCTPEPLVPPEQSGELVVVTRNSPTTYFLDAEDKPKGFEYDLATQFAERNGWKPRFIVVDTLDEMFQKIRTGQAHLAAAGLTVTAERQKTFSFGPAYGQVEAKVVCGQNVKQPRKLEDLIGLRLEVVAGSSHAEILRKLKSRTPAISWVEMKTPGSEELLERMDLGLSDCTVVDSDALDVARNFHPNLNEAFTLEGRAPQAWMMRRGLDVAFSRKVVEFFRSVAKSGDLARLRERYFGHVTRLSEADVLGILDRRTTMLRGMRPDFHAAQSETGLDWRLIAAVAYQESQWDAHAVSPTGVRGMMMLTEDTADRLGVKDRLDARESIMGGARYLALQKAGLPKDIPEPDRTWMALASYNIGSGHLSDARRLARKLGKDPNSWKDIKEVLPLLSRSGFSADLKYGFCRGGEARAFTENVRIYYDILSKYEKPYVESLGFNLTALIPAP